MAANISPGGMSRPIASEFTQRLAAFLRRNPQGTDLMIEDERTPTGEPMICLRGKVVPAADGCRAECCMYGRYFMEQLHYDAVQPIDELGDIIFVKGIASVFPQATADGVRVESNRFIEEVTILISGPTSEVGK